MTGLLTHKVVSLDFSSDLSKYLNTNPTNMKHPIKRYPPKVVLGQERRGGSGCGGGAAGGATRPGAGPGLQLGEVGGEAGAAGRQMALTAGPLHNSSARSSTVQWLTCSTGPATSAALPTVSTERLRLLPQ